MARPTKDGLDYFSFDVDFYNNKKVRKILRACGPASGTVLTCLLCNIYWKKGYYILADEDLSFDIADIIGVSEGAVKEVITKALQVGFFNEPLYDQFKILTSPEILARYKAGTTGRVNVVIIKEYTVYTAVNPISPPDNLVSSTGNTQSKVNETIVNQSKVNNSLVVAAATPGPTKADYKIILEKYSGKDYKDVVPVMKEFLNKRPSFLEPYTDYWNIAVSGTSIAQVKTLTGPRQKKLKTRLDEPAFDFVEIISKVHKSRKLKTESPWFAFDWVFENETNYVKILEGNYDS